MAQVHVKFKYSTDNSKNIISSGSVPVRNNNKTPSESEVIAALEKMHPHWHDFVILEIN